MIILYQFEISPYCDKIRRVLRWKRQPFQIREVSLQESATTLRKINRIGKLPLLEHDGHFVNDSTDIALHLEEAFPERPLLPADRAERALCHVLEDWADESLYFQEMALRFTLPHNAKRWLPELAANDNFVVRNIMSAVFPRLATHMTNQQGTGRKSTEMLLTDVERNIDAVSGILAGRDWLVGDSVCLADIAVFAQLFCIRGSDEGSKLIGARSDVREWMERVDRATSSTAPTTD